MPPVTRSLLPVTCNFDGIPGPTHNYSGLSPGNLAAERHAQLVSNPREAARQGLAKMRALATRGFPQAVLPPHERPAMGALRALGFAPLRSSLRLSRLLRALPLRRERRPTIPTALCK